MKADELQRRLETERIVPISAGDWTEVAPRFAEIERHDTYLVGDLLIVRLGDFLAAVEQPSRDERVLRRLADAEEMRRFVRQRLEEYERMWDGCGCKIDYYT